MERDFLVIFDRQSGKEIFGIKFNNTASTLTAVAFLSANQKRDKCLAVVQNL
jgi:hypothetical protein